jgi:hypothetical protein
LRWVLDEGDGPTAFRLARALGRYWAHRGHLSEGRQWCAEALALVADREAGTALVRLNCLVAAGRLAIGQAAYGEAEQLADEAVALAREHGDPAALVAPLTTQGPAGPGAEPLRRLGRGVRGPAAGGPAPPDVIAAALSG